MTAAFTICSNNYLAHALTLAQSVSKHAPTWRFFIVLVDSDQEVVGITIPADVGIIQIEGIGVFDFDEMVLRYNIIELCTAVKPTCFRHLFSNYPELRQIHYLDPDTALFGDPSQLTDALETGSILLTPHHFTPIPLDGKFPAENLALNHGIFNLGYLGVSRSARADQIIEWWEKRMCNNCRIDLSEGYFVDQIWFNYAPVYFPDAVILRHPGVNAAFWNLHEREIRGGYRVQYGGEDWPLLLFHFSGFSPLDPRQITRIAVREGADEQPALVALLSEYAECLIAQGFDAVRSLECVYVSRRREHDFEVSAAYDRMHVRQRVLRKVRANIPESIKRLLRS